MPTNVSENKTIDIGLAEVANGSPASATRLKEFHSNIWSARTGFGYPAESVGLTNCMVSGGSTKTFYAYCDICPETTHVNVVAKISGVGSVLIKSYNAAGAAVDSTGVEFDKNSDFSSEIGMDHALDFSAFGVDDSGDADSGKNLKVTAAVGSIARSTLHIKLTTTGSNSVRLWSLVLIPVQYGA